MKTGKLFTLGYAAMAMLVNTGSVQAQTLGVDYRVENDCIKSVQPMTSEFLKGACEDQGLGCCVGYLACEWVGRIHVLNVCRNSCVGDNACHHQQEIPFLSIGPNSCNHVRTESDYFEFACYNGPFNVGEGSCRGSYACQGATSFVSNGSCVGRYACNNAKSCNIWNGSCKGSKVCVGAAGANIGDGSCTGDASCQVFTGTAGDCVPACSGDSTCVHQGSYVTGVCLPFGNNAVSCGGFTSPSCFDCPLGNGAAWCSGDCTWDLGMGRCVRAVSCGSHEVAKCSDCGHDHCYGECEWNVGRGECERTGGTVLCYDDGRTASDCAACPRGNGPTWCGGDCEWKNDQCVLRSGA